MNQQENTNAVVFNAPQETNHPSGCRNAEVRKHYFHHQLLLNPNATAQLSDDAWLISFKRRAERFADMLTFLEQSWVEGMPVLQKPVFIPYRRLYPPEGAAASHRSMEQLGRFPVQAQPLPGLSLPFSQVPAAHDTGNRMPAPPPSAESQTIHQEGGR